MKSGVRAKLLTASGALFWAVPQVSLAQTALPALPQSPAGQVQPASSEPVVAQQQATSTEAARRQVQAQGQSETQSQQAIVITANKRADLLSRVPISVFAQTGAELQQRHVVDISDVARITPGVTFESNAGSGQQRNTSITIRGIASVNGVATVGVYLDDSPMTIRNIATGSTNSFYPALFDLNRIEVLRGPQGTLFGSGSEGGTVRFISEQPSLTSFTGHALADFGATESGAPSYQFGVAGGGPLVTDKVGYRASVYYRRDGGYVDKYNFNNGDLIRRNSNFQDTFSGRLAFTFKPTENLRITPAIYVQHLYNGDINRITLPATLNTIAGIPTGTTIQINQHDGNYTTAPNYLKDDFQLASLNASYDFGVGTLTSITSFLNRVQNESDDLHTWVQLFTGAPEPFVPGAPNYVAYSPDRNTARSFSQEIRLASNNPDAPLTWVVGAYYSHLKQVSTQWVYSANFADLSTLPFLGPLLFAPISTQYIQGTDYDVLVRQGVTDEQASIFGQFDYHITHTLTASIGARYERDKENFFEEEGGPLGRGASGRALQQVGPALVANEKTNSFIPKGTLTWQVNPHLMFYATAAKGFRPGGQNDVNGVIPPVCAANLALLGLSTPPLIFGPDNVWSYEVGSKGSTRDGLIQYDGSAFYIKWNKVQQSVNVGCPSPFTANLGGAISKGFDLTLDVRPKRGIDLGVDIGYTRATFNKTVAASTLVFAKSGDPLPNVVPWSVDVRGDIEQPIGNGITGYLRADYQWLSHESKGDPVVVGWDPTIQGNSAFAPNPAYGILNVRVGGKRGPIDFSAYVLNATNKNPHLNYGREQPLVSAIYKYQRIRPRTFGVAVAYRF